MEDRPSTWLVALLGSIVLVVLLACGGVSNRPKTADDELPEACQPSALKSFAVGLGAMAASQTGGQNNARLIAEERCRVALEARRINLEHRDRVAELQSRKAERQEPTPTEIRMLAGYETDPIYQDSLSTAVKAPSHLRTLASTCSNRGFLAGVKDVEASQKSLIRSVSDLACLRLVQECRDAGLQCLVPKVCRNESLPKKMSWSKGRAALVKALSESRNLEICLDLFNIGYNTVLANADHFTDFDAVRQRVERVTLLKCRLASASFLREDVQVPAGRCDTLAKEAVLSFNRSLSAPSP